MSSWYKDWSPNQKFIVSIIVVLGLFATILPSETWKVLVGFTGEQLDRDDVWIAIEEYLDQGLGGSPYQTEKPTLYGLGVVTIAGTDYYYMVDGESGIMLDYSLTESVVLDWVRGNMTVGGNFYIVNNTDTYGYGFEVDHIANNYTYGTYVFGQAGEDLQFGDLLFLETDGDYMLSDANSTATMYVVGMAAQDIANTGWGLILIDGFARCDSWSGFTVGSANPLYAGWQGGDITQSVLTCPGDQVQRVGHPLASKIIRFDPDSTVVEIA